MGCRARGTSPGIRLAGESVNRTVAGSAEMTERQKAAWPECVARLDRVVANVIPHDIRSWSVEWSEEIRPGRGRGLNATFIDGEVFAQIILDVYGFGSESVAELDWVHSSSDEECPCYVCRKVNP